MGTSSASDIRRRPHRTIWHPAQTKYSNFKKVSIGSRKRVQIFCVAKTERAASPGPRRRTCGRLSELNGAVSFAPTFATGEAGEAVWTTGCSGGKARRAETLHNSEPFWWSLFPAPLAYLIAGHVAAKIHFRLHRALPANNSLSAKAVAFNTDTAIVYNEHLEHDGALVFALACRMGLEGTVLKRPDAPYRSGPSECGGAAGAGIGLGVGRGGPKR